MNEIIQELVPYIAPAFVVIGGAWAVATKLWQRVEKKLNENRDQIIQRLDESDKRSVVQDGRLDSHEERLAWLEGNAGQPLHSTRSGGARARIKGEE